MEKVSWLDLARNGEILSLHRVTKERNFLHALKK